ncbi:MAG TPA: hypothetical protein VGM51_13740 [Armatimonadota bacterium]|jgi:hypothetical protein
MNVWKRHCANRCAIPLAVGALLLFTGSMAFAGSFAIKVSNLTLGLTVLYPGQSTTLSYTLAGAGANVAGGIANVKIDFLSGSTSVKTLTIPGGSIGATPGANTVTLNAADIPAGGPYAIRVTATGGSVTATGYIPVSNPNDPNMQFNSPRGIDINRITGSPNKGRIYVTEGAGGSLANRTTVDGVYILNPDLTPAFATPKVTSADIGALGPWAASANSPFRPSVTPDGSILITDASDPHCALFAADANGDNPKAFFAYPYPVGGSRDNNLVYDSLNTPLYGSVSNAIVEGTGTSRVVYTSDEDLAPGNSLHKYAIGTGTQDLAIVPTGVTSFSGVNWYEDFARDSAGNFYLVSDATDDANKLDANGNLVATLPSTGTLYMGICIDEARDMILIGGENGTVYQTNKAFTTVTPLFTGLGSLVRDVAIDPEGWVYAVDSTDATLHVWAPAGTYAIPNGAADGSQTLTIVASPVPGDVSPIGPTGLFVGPNGKRYGDAKVTVQDAVEVLRIAAGLEMGP